MSKYKKIQAALLGAGTVGGGVYKLLQMRAEEMPSKIQAELMISKVLVRNPGKKREGIPEEILTDDWESIINDASVQIVIELMGPHLYSAGAGSGKARSDCQQRSDGRTWERADGCSRAQSL